jgi:hypothetical protein
MTYVSKKAKKMKESKTLENADIATFKNLRVKV